MLEADPAVKLSDDVGVDAVVPLAQLDVNATPHLRVSGDDLAHPGVS